MNKVDINKERVKKFFGNSERYTIKIETTVEFGKFHNMEFVKTIPDKIQMTDLITNTSPRASKQHSSAIRLVTAGIGRKITDIVDKVNE